MTVPTLLTPKRCHAGLCLVHSSISDAMQNGPFNREAGALIVLNPTKLFEPKYDGDPRNEKFLADLPLFMYHWGHPNMWEHPFAHVAVAKAWATFKYSLPASVIQQRCPYLLSEHMTKWGGSAIDPVGGLIVAFSGVQQQFDELISQWMLAALMALSVDAMGDIMAGQSAFIDSTAEEVTEHIETLQRLLTTEKERKLLPAGSN